MRSSSTPAPSQVPPTSGATRIKNVTPLRWKTDQFHRIAEAESGPTNELWELIDGRILVVSSNEKPHSRGIVHSNAALTRGFGESFYVACQIPVDVNIYNVPRPDFAIFLRSEFDDGTIEHARPVLIIEISNTSVSYDRGAKCNLYASAPFNDYWLVDIRKCQVSVFRDPVEDPLRIFGARYATRHVYGLEDVLSPASQLP